MSDRADKIRIGQNLIISYIGVLHKDYTTLVEIRWSWLERVKNCPSNTLVIDTHADTDTHTEAQTEGQYWFPVKRVTFSL